MTKCSDDTRNKRFVKQNIASGRTYIMSKKEHVQEKNSKLQQRLHSFFFHFPNLKVRLQNILW